LGVRIFNRETHVGSGLTTFWTTLYPYLGAETRHDPRKKSEWFFRSRLGLTAYTYEAANSPLLSLPQMNFNPGPGMTALLEFGRRNPRNFLSLYLEGFGWGASQPQYGYVQARTSNLLLGLQGGWFF